jgi:hypothetical protein
MAETPLLFWLRQSPLYSIKAWGKVVAGFDAVTVVVAVVEVTWLTTQIP